MAEPQDRPLWEVMHEAFLREVADNPHAELAEGIQIMIRAIADVVVPEEPEPNPDRFATETELDFRMGQWTQRMATRAKLLAEAECAEKGDANG